MISQNIYGTEFWWYVAYSNNCYSITLPVEKCKQLLKLDVEKVVRYCIIDLQISLKAWKHGSLWPAVFNFSFVWLSKNVSYVTLKKSTYILQILASTSDVYSLLTKKKSYDYCHIYAFAKTTLV